LRGVGENYRDHYAPRMNWRVSLPITLNEQTRGAALVWEIVKYYTRRRGVLSLAAAIAYGFVRTGQELTVPDIQLIFAHPSYSDPQVRTLDRTPGMTLTLYQCRPESTGSIHAKSPDPVAAPAIRPNYLADKLDRRTLVAGMKIARRIVNNSALDRYRAFEMNPGEKCQTDDELLEFARHYGQTAYHVVGTCKMGHDPMAVVNDELQVHGLIGLRIVDASIMPTMTSGNTNAPVIMIAEKGRRHGQSRGLAAGARGVARLAPSRRAEQGSTACTRLVPRAPIRSRRIVTGLVPAENIFKKTLRYGHVSLF